MYIYYSVRQSMVKFKEEVNQSFTELKEMGKQRARVGGRAIELSTSLRVNIYIKICIKIFLPVFQGGEAGGPPQFQILSNPSWNRTNFGNWKLIFHTNSGPRIFTPKNL